ncbi:MAG: 50S ribosomal protein L22 [Anaerolineae bacterium]|jgi:large subunit ribosomal protein L22|uniref:50S ribosomal protein L22 n=1 Tax=Candidatus Amarolinea dominans TaxID=3140696 RepID=UPI001D536CFE|nr:50S ribosomal protein L22 [Anaerolineae bacterium]MBK7201434.1 50S ribosomal protein L22 [Anaerolineae bacterium]MBK9232559.1 50S ribosomal protein L22 [Anaerolineae bacterium]
MSDVVTVRATTKHVGLSAQKVRLVVDQVRGRRATEALAFLAVMPQAAAKPVAATIKSAMANAEENLGLDQENMVVSAIWADVGSTRKWRRFGARGRFKPLLRRSSHICVVLAEVENA